MGVRTGQTLESVARRRGAAVPLPLFLPGSSSCGLIRRRSVPYMHVDCAEAAHACSRRLSARRTRATSAHASNVPKPASPCVSSEMLGTHCPAKYAWRRARRSARRPTSPRHGRACRALDYRKRGVGCDGVEWGGIRYTAAKSTQESHSTVVASLRAGALRRGDCHIACPPTCFVGEPACTALISCLGAVRRAATRHGRGW